ncbi:MAG TPA: hypothetical protein VMB51_06970 [Solirubrobacteraceae bacterium]|nr:hypothetical protein [Solirubrobacteraceae bacterium]
MSPTLAVSLNVLADLGLLALLAFLMSQARHLTPHLAGAGDAQAQPARRPERAGAARPVAGATSVPVSVGS